jgi:Fe-S cluster biogenesis protein NfuA
MADVMAGTTPTATTPTATTPTAPTPTAPTPTAPTSTASADEEAEELLHRLNELLEQLERLPGPAGKLAMDAVAALSELYGTALARVMTLVDGEPRIPGVLAEDELLQHLLVLHGIHPLPVADRVAGALDQLRPHVRSHGGALVLDGIDGGVARIVVPAGCPGGCGPVPAALREAIVSCVLTAAPELSDVEIGQERGGSAPTLIAAESLLRKPGGGKPGGGPGAGPR